MMSGIEIRQHVAAGLASGRLWRLTQDRGKVREETSAPCHVCERGIPRGQAYAVAGAAVTVLVHLECYLFWLHASGLFALEPITCASCRKLIPPHAEQTVMHGEAYHSRCWDRMEDPEAAVARRGSL
jgi:hypothetical protein